MVTILTPPLSQNMYFVCYLCFVCVLYQKRALHESNLRGDFDW